MTTWLESLVFKLEPTKPSKSVGPFFWEWKTLPAKSTGLRIQLSSTENRRYQKNTSLIAAIYCIYFSMQIDDYAKDGGPGVV